MSASMDLVLRKAKASRRASAQRAVPLPDRSVLGYDLELLESRRLLSNGFGDHGWTHADFPGYTDGWVTVLKAAPNGQIYAGGTVSGNTSNGDMGIARFNADGSVDTSFGTDGDGTVAIPMADTTVADKILVQPDGKILLLGESPEGLALVRLNTDGSVDTSFGGGPQLFTNFNGFMQGSVEYQDSMSLMNNGDVMLVAMDGPNLITMKLTPNGQPDTSFAPGGIVSVQLDATGDPLQSDDLLAAQPTADGGIIGYADLWTPVSSDNNPEDGPFSDICVAPQVTVQLVQIQTDASGNIVSQKPVALDLAQPNYADTGYTPDYYLLLNPDGSAYVSSAAADPRIAKLTPGGMVDTSFGSNGYVTTPGSYAQVIGLTADGGALVESGAYDTFFVGSSNTVEKMNSDGSIDTGFNGGQPAGEGAYPALGLADGSTLFGNPWGYNPNTNAEAFVIEEIPGNGQEDFGTNDPAALQAIASVKAWADGDFSNLFSQADGSTVWSPDGSPDVYGDPISAT
jgi:uncharacterized delta-60 repeat protein